MKKVNCELKEAKKAVKEATKVCVDAIRACYEVVNSIDFTGYIPKEIPDDVINEVQKKLPKDVSGAKLAYEVSCHYWRVRCLADTRYVAAEKAIKEAQEVLRSKEEELKKLKDSLKLK
jgi:hypothetical protein